MRKPLHHETLKKKKKSFFVWFMILMTRCLNSKETTCSISALLHKWLKSQTSTAHEWACFMCFSSHTVTFSRRLLFWTQTVTGMRFVVIKRCYSQFNLLSQAEWGNELPRGSAKQTEGLVDKLWKNDLVDGGWRITERKRLMSHSHEGNQSQLIKAFLTKIIQCCQKVFAFFLF